MVVAAYSCRVVVFGLNFRSDCNKGFIIEQPPHFEYQHLLKSLKSKIKAARVKAIISVNAQLLGVYWEIGSAILEQQRKEGWGAKIIDRLAADLKVEFPDETGFSVRNLKYMRAFAEAYPGLYQSRPIAPESKGKRSRNVAHNIVQAPLAQKEPENNGSIVQDVLALLS